uniref:Putative secreted protein n=1 Tax=Anopheles darlingi TaxID=43151 RepID=A0A2M4DB21_ANODA
MAAYARAPAVLAISTATGMFATVDSVWWRAGMAKIVRLVNAASTVCVRCRARTTVSVVNGRPVLPEVSVRSDAVAARIVADQRRASTSSV